MTNQSDTASPAVPPDANPITQDWQRPIDDKTPKQGQAVPPKLPPPREQLLDEARKRYESASSEDDKQYWREQIAFLSTHIDVPPKLTAEQFNAQELKIQWTNPIMPEEIYQFAEAYAQHVAAGVTRGEEDYRTMRKYAQELEGKLVKVEADVERLELQRQGASNHADRAESEVLKLREALLEVGAILQDCDLESDYYLDSQHSGQELLKQRMFAWLDKLANLRLLAGEKVKP